MGVPIKNRRVQVEVSGWEGLKCLPAKIFSGEIYYVSSGDVWAVTSLVVEGLLRIDGEVHAWGDVTGSGAITGEGELRLHSVVP